METCTNRNDPIPNARAMRGLVRHPDCMVAELAHGTYRAPCRFGCSLFNAFVDAGLPGVAEELAARPVMRVRFDPVPVYGPVLWRRDGYTAAVHRDGTVSVAVAVPGGWMAARSADPAVTEAVCRFCDTADPDGTAGPDGWTSFLAEEGVDPGFAACPGGCGQ